MPTTTSEQGFPRVVIAKGYETRPLLTVGDTVPETSNPSKQYQIVGIPDGLGAHKDRRGTTVVYMNHELGFTTLSRTTVGEPRDRGAVVSKLVLDRDGKVSSAERAYDEVYLENTLVGPAATEANATRGFARFCSGSLAERNASTATSTSRTRNQAARARSTGSEDSRLQWSTTRRTACRSSVTLLGRTRSRSRSRVVGRSC